MIRNVNTRNNILSDKYTRSKTILNYGYFNVKYVILHFLKFDFGLVIFAKNKNVFLKIVFFTLRIH